MRTSPTPTRRPGEPVRGDRLLVVLGGLPGSGKTTLLRRLLAERLPGVRGVDAEQVTEELRRARVRVPYHLLRPLVHSCHRVRVLAAVISAAPVVVLTDPWTSATWRSVVLRAARCGGRTVSVVLLDATPEQAHHGRAVRGRTLPARMVRRHTARWDAVLADAAREVGRVAEAERTLVVDRDGARTLTVADVLGAS